MEKLIERRGVRVLAAGVALAIVGLAFTGCGNEGDDHPRAGDVNENLEYFELDGVVAGNGEPVRCVLFGENGPYESWFGYTCDFEGTATFPSEVPQTTPTTLG